jgi:hypothetical protein
MGLRKATKELLPELITRVARVLRHKDIHGIKTAYAIGKRG